MELRNPVKEKLLAGQVSIGSWCLSGSALAGEALASAGFDWVQVDMEHFPIDMEAAANCFRGIQLAGAVPMARLPACDPIWIKRSLDAGALGVTIPLVRCVADVAGVVEWSRFPPRGRRPCGGGRVQFLYGPETYLSGANNAILVLVQIETREAVQDLEAILKVEGVDGYLVGPTDLSLSMGWPPPPAPCPEREELIASLALRIAKAGRVPATVSSSPEQARQRIDQGYRMVSILSDLSLLSRAAREALLHVGDGGR